LCFNSHDGTQERQGRKKTPFVHHQLNHPSDSGLALALKAFSLWT
jgi:hypothetical protein